MSVHEIVLERGGDEPYVVGDSVVGVVNITLPKPKSVTSVDIRLCGEIYTHWNEGDNGVYHTEDIFGYKQKTLAPIDHCFFGTA